MENQKPVTFNLALDLRTVVRIMPYTPNLVRITSTGFAPAECHFSALPFDHPLGLMFAVCAYFNVRGVDISIESASVPRSGLGGSSSAALALTAAMARLCEKTGTGPAHSRADLVKLAHLLEEDAAKSVCGIQDHLAAAHGGANAWYWNPRIKGPAYRRRTVVKKSRADWINRRFLVAFCGQTHVSARVNGKWLDQFAAGRTRHVWQQINQWSNSFVNALLGRQGGGGGAGHERGNRPALETDPGGADPGGPRAYQPCHGGRVRRPVHRGGRRRLRLGAGGSRTRSPR